MKFDSLLAQYLYENRKLQLQGIGSFELDNAVNVHHEQDKETYYPIEGLTFTYNTKEITTEELIAFLVKKLGKIQPLVRSDLDSYLSNIKQFLNIGKPYTIEGVGTLNKNNQGTYEFTPGNFIPVKEELHPKREKAEAAVHVPKKERNSGKAFAIILIIVASIAVLGGIVWGVSTFFVKEEPVNEYNSVGEEVADTATSKKPDTAVVTRNEGVSSNDSTGYKMIFEITKLKARAYTRTANLRKGGQNIGLDSLTINDTLKYRMYVPIRARPSDTTRIKDSLRRWYARPIRVDKL